MERNENPKKRMRQIIMSEFGERKEMKTLRQEDMPGEEEEGYFIGDWDEISIKDH